MSLYNKEIEGESIDGFHIPLQISVKNIISINNSHSCSSHSLFTNNKNQEKMLKIVSFIDLTSQKEVQQALLQAERERQANDAKSNFLAHMSHEIRTPLNGILGMMQLLSDTNLTNEQKEILCYGNTSVQILLTVINDILDFSKIEAGLLDIEYVEFELNPCIESVK